MTIDNQIGRDLRNTLNNINEIKDIADEATIALEEAKTISNESKSILNNANSAIENANSAAENTQARLTELEGVDAVQFKNRQDGFDVQLAQTAEKIIDSSIVFNIPSDFPTLQAAIDNISEKIIAKKSIIELRIETGHRPSSGISIENRDCSNFKITSAGGEVLVSDLFTGHFIHGVNSQLPILSCLVNMNNKGGDGCSVTKHSRMRVEYNCGVKNAGGRGCYVAEMSTAYARASIFTGSNNRNVWVTRTSIFEGELGNFSANKGGENAVYVSRVSSANLLSADVSNAFENGICVTRSTVNCEGANVSNAGKNGIITQSGSRISAEHVNATFCGLNGMLIDAGTGGTVRGSDVSNATETGLLVRMGSTINAWEVKANNCGVDGIRADESAVVNARSTIVKNNANFDLRVVSGASMNANGSQTTNGTPAVGDCSVTQFNTFHGRQGVIFA